MIALLAAGLIAPFYAEVTPEVRTTYVSLGKLIEDRPMQVTHIRAGWDTGIIGRVGFYNWDVSSLSDRCADVHRHALYHTEYGPTWGYDFAFNDEWKLKNELMCVWTLYRGFEKIGSNGEYWWWQAAQSLENPYLVPYYRLRRYCSGSYYFWVEAGVRHTFTFLKDCYLTPSVYMDGGNDLNYERVIGKNACGTDWGGGGLSSLSFRLELGWKASACATVFAFVEQYEVVGHDARATNAQSSNKCAHNDWTFGGIGIRFKF